MKSNRLSWLFASVILFVTISDSIMSYVSPVYINKIFNNTFIVGLILSTSSLMGIMIDIVVVKNFSKQKYKFYIIIMLIFALLFPLIFLFGSHVLPIFLIGMFIWSIYYEFRDFSKYNFIRHFLPSDQHTSAWTKIIMLQSLACIIGTVLVFWLIKISDKQPLYVAVFSSSIAILVFVIFKRFANKIKREVFVSRVHKSSKLEFKILKTLLRRVGVLFAFSFTVVLIDVSFWTIGVLLSEELRKITYLGGLLMIVYGIPGVYGGLIANKIHYKFGKKRTMFVTGILAGITLFVTATTNNMYVLLGSVLIASTGHTVCWVLINAVCEDYVARLGVKGNDMVTINQITVNLAYVLGPITFGALAIVMPLQSIFGIVGIIVASFSITALATTPRKIKMPQKELHELSS